MAEGTRHNSNVTPARNARSTYSLRSLYGGPYPPLDPVAYSRTITSTKFALFLGGADEEDASSSRFVVGSSRSHIPCNAGSFIGCRDTTSYLRRSLVTDDDDDDEEDDDPDSGFDDRSMRDTSLTSSMITLSLRYILIPFEFMRPNSTISPPAPAPAPARVAPSSSPRPSPSAEDDDGVVDKSLHGNATSASSFSIFNLPL